MSTETEDQEIAQLKEQIEQAAEGQAGTTPSPEPVAEEVVVPEPAAEAVAPNQSEPEVKPKGEDDPMEWAKKKGFKTSEDMARALIQKEQEFHKRNQAGHPGYQDLNNPQPAQPPVNNWQPRPDMGNQQYPQYPQPAYQPRTDFRDVAALYPGLHPDDVKNVMPLIMDAARLISAQDKKELEQKYAHIERTTARNNELMTLMQDPAFRDERVQKEVHQILDADPSIFQRERTPLVYAFKEAVFNMGRKQLQQGVSSGNEPVKGNNPPVTAGGGNGSANTVPRKPTESEMERWTADQIGAYMKSGGKIIPKAKA